MKIGTRYTLFSLVAAAVPIGLIVAVLFVFTHHELERMQAKDLQNVRQAVSSDIADLQRAVVSDIGVISEDLEWTRLLLQKDASERIDQLALIEKATSHCELLGLKYIELISPDSILLARSGDYSDFGLGIDRPLLDTTSAKSGGGGLAALDVAGDTEACMIASRGIYYRGNLIAYLQGGKVLDSNYLSHLKSVTGCAFALLIDGRLHGSGLDRTDRDLSLSGTVAFTSIDGSSDILVGFEKPESNVERLLAHSLWLYGLVALAGIVLSGVIGYFSSRHLTVPVNELVRAAEDISRGKFEQRIIWFAKDELGTLVEGFNSMYDRLKVSQEKLIQTEKVAAWKQMARKVAHEIKNPLTPIRLSVEDLKRSYDLKSPEFEEILNGAVETIGSEIARLTRLTDEFSQFARLPAPELLNRDIRPVIADALRIYGEKIRAEKLRVKFPQNVVSVALDADLFSQALVNLVKNGFEAAGENGIVDVVLEEGSRIARVCVEDNGPGVSDEAVQKLFTPHFTTKKDGTGLGLVIAYRIAFDHGGRIRFEKRDPNGSRFIIVLPLVER